MEELIINSMTDYIVIESKDIREFEESVKQRLNDGYKLQGGISITLYEDKSFNGVTYIRTILAQALTKEI